MSGGKSFFMDLTRCTACRGCQIACKQWNNLPATETVNWGSRQNPRDLNPVTYKLVRFTETMDGSQFKWLFFPEQCRHCLDAPCKAYADSYDEGAIIHDKATGAVVFTDKTAVMKDVADPLEMCPYNIPRKDEKTGIWHKCTMCHDRVAQGLKPACVTSCPTGTMNFGERDEMLELAHKRLAEVRKAMPKALLVDADAVRVIVLAETDPRLYYQNLRAEAAPVRGPMDRRSLLAGLVRPLRAMG